MDEGAKGLLRIGAAGVALVAFITAYGQLTGMIDLTTGWDFK